MREAQTGDSPAALTSHTHQARPLLLMCGHSLLQVGFTFNDAWAGLMNKCLEARMPQFTYK